MRSFNESIFYHIYPLGLCGAPKKNDLNADSVNRIELLYSWIDHISCLGFNAVYLGPVFESSSHGYDTIDYFKVDRRLGTSESLKEFVNYLHGKGIKVILDGVFNHVGREFWAFRDLQNNLHQSRFKDWFKGLNFDYRSPLGDLFTYDTWNGYYELIKLNLDNPEVYSHILHAVSFWMDEFKIDGLRLDAADCLEFTFLKRLSYHCKNKNPDFFLLGEVIHGDYTRWVNSEMLDSVTNYECYKGLYSSHNDENYFEIAYSLNRQFGEHGIYKGLPLYSFADNHDVNRLASVLKNKAHIYPAYCLLFTMPGLSSVYYGSERGLTGEKFNGSDDPLRPYLDFGNFRSDEDGSQLEKILKKLINIRKNSSAITVGSYKQIFVDHKLLGFQRESAEEALIIVINSSNEIRELQCKVFSQNGTAVDLLNNGDEFQIREGILNITSIYPNWARIIRIKT